MATDKRDLTAKQQQVLNFMKSFFDQNDQIPPMHAIRDHFGWKSNNAAQEHCDALETHGRIEKNAVGKFRFVRERESGLTLTEAMRP